MSSLWDAEERLQEVKDELWTERENFQRLLTMARQLTGFIDDPAAEELMESFEHDYMMREGRYERWRERLAIRRVLIGRTLHREDQNDN